MIKSLWRLVLLLAVWNQDTAINAQRSSALTCRTPQNRIGQCVPLNKCKEILWMIKNKSDDPVALRHMKNSKCSAENESLKVCCTSNSAAIIAKIAPDTEECGLTDTSLAQKIVGGQDAQLGDYPWMAALGYRRSKSSKVTMWFCGGALISSRYVLTAGHCLSGTEQWQLNDYWREAVKESLQAAEYGTCPKRYKVRLGDINLQENIEDFANPVDIIVEKTVVHEKYSSTPAVVNDIGLIRLKQAAPYNEYIKPICLPLQSQFRARSMNNEFAYVAGWGRTSEKGPFSSALQDVAVPIVDLEHCKKVYRDRPLAHVDSRNLCAGYTEGKKDSCQGDSGGPLMWRNQSDARYYALGIVSFGYKCAEKGFPGVYTKVSEFLDFIAFNMY